MNQSRRAGGPRKPRARGFAAVMLCAAGCAKIVGIEDTEVTRGVAGAAGQNAPYDASAADGMAGAGASGSAGTGGAGTGDRFDANFDASRVDASGTGNPMAEAGGQGGASARDSALDVTAGAGGQTPTAADARGAGSAGQAPIDASREGGGPMAFDAGRDSAGGQGDGADAGLPRDAAPEAPLAADTGADLGICSTGSRCGALGRETCSVGQWASDPCPVNQPTCDNGQCVVRGPVMVPVSTFYIDSTEVTVADYSRFLAAKGSDMSGQPAVCSWNTTYYDAALPLGPALWPMTNVDWCDARAYCAWAGKRLCGKIGGGPIARAEAFTSSVSQWFLACGGPNGASHPNGNAVCNSSGGARDLAPVQSYPGCEGSYPGIFDMEGNAAEWVDSCQGNSGAADICHLFGGGIYDSRSYCTESYDEFRRDDTSSAFGFRCCGG